MTFWGADGKPISAAEFIENLYGDLNELLKNEEELRLLWSQPDTRKKLMQGLAEKGYDKEKIKQYSIIINTSANDLYNLTENLLHWARCQSDKIKHNPKKIDLNELVVNVIYILQISAKKKNIIGPQMNAKTANRNFLLFLTFAFFAFICG